MPHQQIQLNGFDLAVFLAYMALAVGLGFVVSIGKKYRDTYFGGDLSFLNFEKISKIK